MTMDSMETLKFPSRQDLLFFVNGRKVLVPSPDPEETLLQFLRNTLSLRGTKLGCAEGGCGACTVMVSRYDRRLDQVVHYSVNACLAPVCSMHGLAVTTVEGIGSTKTRLHDVQERLARSHGSQCGFCTPGIVMSMYTLLRNDPIPDESQLEKAFEGNLCRCTGYRPILEGFHSFTKQACAMGDQCCRKNLTPCNSSDDALAAGEPAHEPSYDPSQEPIFPPELKLSDLDKDSLHVKGARMEWFRPTSLVQLLALMEKYPHAKLVCGNTELGVEVKFKDKWYPILITPTHIPELTEILHTPEGVVFGASVTLTQMDSTLKKLIISLPNHETRVFRAIVEMLRWFAGPQIRNVSSLAGNLITASPISDLNPLYLAAGVVVEVVSSRQGRRRVPLDGQFFLGYRKIKLEVDEVLLNIHIPKTSEFEYFSGYKQAHRKEDDIAIVNAGMRVKIDPKTLTVLHMSLAFGGMAPITVMCSHTAEALRGRVWDDKLLEEACELLKSDLPLSDSAPGGMIAFRRTLTSSFFYKFYLTVRKELQCMTESVAVEKNYLSATEMLERGPTKGIQIYQEEEEGVGDCWKAIPTKSAELQCTGEAQYIDDIPPYKDELYMSLVYSTVAHGKVKGIDASEALQVPGVVDFVSEPDVKGSNIYRHTHDELVFCTKEVTCMGQICGAILANSQRQAQIGAKKVKIDYENLPAIFTIEEAIEAKSFHDPKKDLILWKGDVNAAFDQSDLVFSGEMRVGGQEHFYLETQAVLAIPKENGEMEIFSSTQNPTETQMCAATTLNVPSNRITVRVKRMGGGFGGKETRSLILALPAAVAASKHQKPVRCMLDRDEDMMSTGTRHSFLGKYKVGMTHDGQLLAVDVQLYSNAGNTMDLSVPVMERAMFSLDNAYNIPNMRVQGWVCKTNIPSNTAFRGFGGPQGMMVMETIISHAAAILNKPADLLRERHLYKDGDATHYGQPIVNCNISKCWTDVLSQSDYERRQAAVAEYNRHNRWRKRGISSVATKFGISFTFSMMNQSSALVHIYQDGSVLVQHGGTEMGQGLFTKMIQVASTALQIPSDKIYTSEVSTATIANTSPTAASCGSDLNGAAVLNACLELRKRLEPYIAAKPGGTWEQWVHDAFMNRVSLTAAGYYSTPDLTMDWSISKGTPFAYFTFGAAISEVEIDCLTGDHQVLRTDIVMDVGKSLNPAIDVGQIEGGFVQGYGLFCLEQLKLKADTGYLLTRGPGAYKIPSFGNVPQEFNVTLLKDVPNVKAVYSSKAIGEPPLFLSASVFFAIKEAVSAAREDAGKSRLFRLDSPCTPERIRMACADQFTQQFADEAVQGIPRTSFFIEP